MEIYAAMVNDLDTYIGQLIDFLKVSKQYENTVIIFLADGGVSEPKTLKTPKGINNTLDNLGKANSLITLGKSWTSLKFGDRQISSHIPFNDAVKVPLIISSPLLKHLAGSRATTIRTVNDITPTILKMIGLPHPSDSYFEGVLSVEGQPLF